MSSRTARDTQRTLSQKTKQQQQKKKKKEEKKRKKKEISRLAGWWWHTPLIPALGRQRQADFWVRGQPGPQCEFQDSQGFTEKSCIENKTKKKKKQKTKKSTTINKTLWNLHKAQLNHWWHWTMCLFDTSTVMALVTCRQSWFPQLHIFLGDSEAKRESTWASGSSWQSLCDVL